MLHVKIREAILNNPGISISQIFDYFPESNESAIIHALKILLNYKEIVVKGRRFYTVEEVHFSERILTTVKSHPGLSVAEIAEKVGCSMVSVRSWGKTFSAEGKIRIQKIFNQQAKKSINYYFMGQFNN